VAVRFDGLDCDALTVLSSTHLTCQTPAHPPGAVDVVAVLGGTTRTLAQGFTYLAAPTVVSVSPPGGPIAGGTALRIRGSEFADGATVDIGDNPCLQTAFVDATELTCLTPAAAGAGPVSVRVTNPDAQSSTLAGGFRYNDAPRIDSVTPDRGPTGGSTVLNLTGAELLEGATVELRDSGCGQTSCAAPCTVGSAGGTALSCTTSAHAAGLVGVYLENSDGQSTLAAAAFTYVPPPTLHSLTPSVGTTGELVSIAGADFQDAPTVTLDGLPCESVTFVSESELTCITPAHAPGLVPVVVTNPDGQSATLVDGFQYRPPPTITGLTPNVGHAGGTTAVTIAGTGFLDGATVTLGGVSCGSLSYTSPTRLDCEAPAWTLGATSVGVDVVVPNPDGQSATRGQGFVYYKPGLVDHTFSGGVVSYLNGTSASGGESFRKVIALPDGKLLVAGFQALSATKPARDILLARYTVAGTLDPTFGTGGIVTRDYGGDDEAYSMVLQPDGRIVVVGRTARTTADMALVRFTYDGGLEQETVIDFGQDDVATSVALQPGGEIVLAGCSGTYDFDTDDSGSASDIAVVRLLPNLAFDTSFSGSGSATWSWGATGPEAARDVWVDATGSTVNGIVLSGYSWCVGCYLTASVYYSAFIRLTPAGDLDTAFNGTGSLRFRHGTESLTTATAARDGMLVPVDGSGTLAVKYYFGTMRFDAVTAAFDTGFSGDGRDQQLMGVNASGRADMARAVVIDSAGRIVVAGSAAVDDVGDEDLGLLRYNPNGTLDASFGSGGKVITRLGLNRERCRSLAIQQVPTDSVGRLVCAGWTGTCGINARQEECIASDAVLVRYWQ